MVTMDRRLILFLLHVIRVSIADVAEDVGVWVPKSQNMPSLMRVNPPRLTPGQREKALDQAHLLRIEDLKNSTTPVSAAATSAAAASWRSSSAAVGDDGATITLSLQRSAPQEPVQVIPMTPTEIQRAIHQNETAALAPMDCPAPAAGNRRGYVVSGAFFLVVALSAFKREAWWRCTDHADAQGPFEMWTSKRISTCVTALFTGLAVAELAWSIYSQGLSWHLMASFPHAVTYGILTVLAWMDAVSREHKPVYAARIISVALAVTLLVEVVWFQFTSPGNTVMHRMLTYLRLTALGSAVALCTQAAFPSSNLRCAACFFIALHGVLCMDIGLWHGVLRSPTCTGDEDVQLAAADHHVKVEVASVAISLAAWVGVAYWWAIHVQQRTIAECRALTTAAMPRNHE